MVLLQVILTRLSFGLQKTMPIRGQSLLQFFVVNQFSRCGKMWDKELLRKPHNLAMESNSRILQSKCIKIKLSLSKKRSKKINTCFLTHFFAKIKNLINQFPICVGKKSILQTDQSKQSNDFEPVIRVHQIWIGFNVKDHCSHCIIEIFTEKGIGTNEKTFFVEFLINASLKIWTVFYCNC